MESGNLFSNLKVDKLVHANGFVVLIFAFCTRQIHLEMD